MRALAVLAILMVCACTTTDSIDRVAEMRVEGDAFSRALHQTYVEFAYTALERGDTSSAALFRDKARQSAKGKVVLPEDPENWANESYDLGPLRNDYAYLRIPHLSERPDSAAATDALAQVAFDCVVVLGARLGLKPDDPESAEARSLLECYQTYNRLTVVELDPCGGLWRDPAPLASSYIIYFDAAQLDPTRPSQAIFDFAASQMTQFSPVSVRIAGYTDTRGSIDENLDLSRVRAERLAAFLVARGVDESVIEVAWYGEAELLIPTADSVDEPNNRRVEIMIEWPLP